MFLDKLLDLLQEYKTRYPHRQIEIRGELDVTVPHGNEEDTFKVKLESDKVVDKNG